MVNNAVHWFEIPATDLDRAVRFYNQVFGLNMSVMDMMGTKMAMFPCEGVGGALIQHEMHVPSEKGTLVYLDGGADLSAALGKVAAAGGQVVKPKTSIGEHGYCAMFVDPEGNRVGLHSMG